jgi:hypothetical protein
MCAHISWAPCRAQRAAVHGGPWRRWLAVLHGPLAASHIFLGAHRVGSSARAHALGSQGGPDPGAAQGCATGLGRSLNGSPAQAIGPVSLKAHTHTHTHQGT